MTIEFHVLSPLGYKYRSVVMVAIHVSLDWSGRLLLGQLLHGKWLSRSNRTYRRICRQYRDVIEMPKPDLAHTESGLEIIQ